MSYYAVVERNPNVEKGPGAFRLYLDNELVREFSCITGGAQLDSRKYGGLTPELAWVMIQPIAMRDHPSPNRGEMEMAIIVPYAGGKTFFPNRTLYGEQLDPYMVHIAGTSTGCIAIKKEEWRDFVECINGAFEAESFPIYVKNSEPYTGE